MRKCGENCKLKTASSFYRIWKSNYHTVPRSLLLMSAVHNVFCWRSILPVACPCMQYYLGPITQTVTTTTCKQPKIISMVIMSLTWKTDPFRVRRLYTQCNLTSRVRSQTPCKSWGRVDRGKCCCRLDHVEHRAPTRRQVAWIWTQAWNHLWCLWLGFQR